MCNNGNSWQNACLQCFSFSSSFFLNNIETLLRISILFLILICLIIILLGILFCYKRFFCGGKRIHRSLVEQPTCPPFPPPSMRPFEALKSVSNFNSEFETAPSSFKNWNDRKISAPTLLIGHGQIKSYPTFVY